ncbi:MAG: 2-oxoacid:acceptor oxidoreductase family protein [Caldisericia bacterium]|nr:2-oxoacid:acceptor oxidoreductase family protein [Caldisericia bacterium]
MKKSFLFNGKGGQGTIFISIILAKSAILSNLYAIQTQHYSAAQRGDIVKSLVIVSDEEIFYPKIQEVDFFISYDLKAFLNFRNYINEKSLIIYDNSYEDLNEDFKNNNIFKLPLTKYSIENFKTKELANVISLGFLSNFLDFINIENFYKVFDNLEKGDKTLNKEAFDFGRNLKVPIKKGGSHV